jgi:Fe-S-cluster containining protein
MDDLDAGDFSSWLASTQRAIGGEGDAEVPCDGCTACCRSSQFVHIGPDEADTLAHIPEELLFPAPHMSRGHVVLGYDERGHCPMLVENRCSVYAHRPRACRVYDCRVFRAAGLELEDPVKVEINERARRWRFHHPTARDREQHDAVRAAAESLRRHPERLPDGVTSTNITQIAVLAIEAVSGRA